MSSRFISLALAAVLTLPAFARVQPTTGFDLYSRDDELQVGKEAVLEMNRGLPLLPDSSPVSRYVSDLGKKLAAHAPGEPWPYAFHVVNQKEINAFALPGGTVYINLGTIQAADNEAELAGVLAHEIAHVVQRHGTRAASKQMAAEVPLALLAGMLGKSTAAQAAAFGISFGVGSYFLKNSRQSESEADLLGADIMYDAGYDPHALAEFFTKLQDEAGGRGSELDQFFSDHPDPGNRVEAVNQEAATLASKVYVLNSPEFLSIKQTVSGMKPMTAEQIAAWQKKHARAE
ncbi:MAG: M48 family metallopeptidase [Terriglobales bacterium]|jgi:predicted Zn-dependent protease